jgi:tetratricopeptide (TPR) repeat protein
MLMCADYLLYSRYSYGDIVDTLVSYCKLNNLDKKRTYIWICFLCVNQHRVVEKLRQGSYVPLETFRDCFQSRLLGIRHILAMMAPYEDPSFLRRVWCLFELYQASCHGDQVKVTVVMPPEQAEAMEKSLLVLERVTGSSLKDVNTLYGAVTKTRLQTARASFEDDRVKIMELIKKHPGYRTLNQKVHQWLREWIHSLLVDQIVEKYAAKERENDSAENVTLHATVRIRVGEILRRNNHNLPRAKDLLGTAISSISGNEAVGNHNNMLGRAQSGLGLVLRDQGSYKDSLQSLRAALSSTLGYYQSLESNEEPLPDENKMAREIALCHANIGSVLYAMGKADEAMVQYKTALKGYSNEDDECTAAFYNGIADILCFQGDTKTAKGVYFKALRVLRGTVGESHPETATCISNFALCSAGPAVKIQLSRALKIRLEIFGRNHVDTAASYANLGMFEQDSGKSNVAIENYQEALEIYREVLNGEGSASMAKLLTDLGNAMKSECKFEKAMEAQQEALRIQVKVYDGENHPDVAVTYNNIGIVEETLDNLERAREMYQKALDILLDAVRTDSEAVAIAMGGQDEVDYVVKKVGDRVQRVEKYLRNGGKARDVKKMELKRQVLKKRLTPEEAQKTFETLEDSGALGPPLQLQQ